MPTISNTSPLLYLHQTRRLDVLRQLYERVSVAPAVLSELRAGMHSLEITLQYARNGTWPVVAEHRRPAARSIWRQGPLADSRQGCRHASALPPGTLLNARFPDSGNPESGIS